MLKVDLRPSQMAFGSRRIHYGWVIVVLAGLMWMTSGSIRFSASVLIPHFHDPDGMGWSYAAVGFGFSLQWFLSGFAGPVVGWLGDRYGVRRTMFVGALLFIAGMMLTGTMTQLWQFYLYFGVILGIVMSIFQVPLISGASGWFRTHLGLAMGSLQFIQSLGIVMFIPLMAFLFANYGLMGTFWFPGIIGGVVLLVLTRPFYSEPAAIGMRPFGAPENEPIRQLQSDATAKLRTSAFFRQAQRTSAFWNLIGIHFWGCMGHNVFIVFLIAMIEDQGISRALAIGAFITMHAVSTTARFLIPVAADMLGAKGIMAVCFALHVFPPLILVFFQDPWAFYLFAVLFGIGLGGEVPLFPIINRQYYGSAPIGTVYGWQMFGNGIGMGLGPLVGGFLWDFTGNFLSIVFASVGFSLMGLVSVLVLPRTSHVLTPNWEDSLPPEARSASQT